MLAAGATGAIALFPFAEDKGARSCSQAPSDPRGRCVTRRQYEAGEAENGDHYSVWFSLSVRPERGHRFQREWYGRKCKSKAKYTAADLENIL